MAFKKGTNNADARRGNYAPGAAGHPEEKRAAARALYEGDPQCTQEAAAREAGVSLTTLRRWIKDDGWKKLTGPELSQRAQRAADSYVGQLAEIGPEITAEQKAEVQTAVSEQTAVDLRAGVIDRHRREWGAPRKLSYEAVQKRDFELAKLAKITSETLRNVQEGERKAWGLDSKDENGNAVTVVIERD